MSIGHLFGEIYDVRHPHFHLDNLWSRLNQDWGLFFIVFQHYFLCKEVVAIIVALIIVGIPCTSFCTKKCVKSKDENYDLPIKQNKSFANSFSVDFFTSKITTWSIGQILCGFSMTLTPPLTRVSYRSANERAAS